MFTNKKNKKVLHILINNYTLKNVCIAGAALKCVLRKQNDICKIIKKYIKNLIYLLFFLKKVQKCVKMRLFFIVFNNLRQKIIKNSNINNNKLIKNQSFFNFFQSL